MIGADATQRDQDAVGQAIPASIEARADEVIGWDNRGLFSSLVIPSGLLMSSACDAPWRTPFAPILIGIPLDRDAMVKRIEVTKV